MNLSHVFPLLLACAISLPALAQTNDARIYTPPESMAKNIRLYSSTENSVTFRFSVKSMIGNATEVKLKARVLGNDKIVPVPNIKEIREINEGKIATLEFVVPITPEQVKDKSLKIQGDVEYLPDYEAIINRIENDTKGLYQIEPLKENLINSLNRNKENVIKSVQSIRYFPETK
jgi:hypothetical protein